MQLWRAGIGSLSALVVAACSLDGSGVEPFDQRGGPATSGSSSSHGSSTPSGGAPSSSTSPSAPPPPSAPSASDGGTSATLPASQPSTPKAVSCGSTSCPLQNGDVVCCYAGPASTCTAPEDCNTRVTFACDEDADCGSGNTCCFTGSQTYCADSCDPGDSQVCGSQSCPASEPTCRPSGFPMFGTCTP